MENKEKTYDVWGKHLLSAEERAEKALELAETVNDLQGKEDEKKKGEVGLRLHSPLFSVITLRVWIPQER